MSGKIIVLEGLDGSGKTTQFEGLLNYYQGQNINIKGFSFPNYEEGSSALIKMYLNGEIAANANDVNAYAVSAFYAVDRFASYKRHFEGHYQSGGAVLLARYTTSNVIYQMSKLRESEWEGYTDWLYDFEYHKMGLPRPDLVIYLDMPTDISQSLLSRRYAFDEGKKDLHEKNISFMKNCEKAARYAVNHLGWISVPCCDDKGLRSIEDIQKDLTEEINQVL